MIEIDRGQLGLGPLRRWRFRYAIGKNEIEKSLFFLDRYFCCFFSRRLLFTIFTMVVLHNVMVDLQVGDQILEVNSINLRSATHDETIQALRQSTHLIRLVVYRGDIENEDEKFDIISVELTKRAGKGLGQFILPLFTSLIQFFLICFQVLASLVVDTVVVFSFLIS